MLVVDELSYVVKPFIKAVSLLKTEMDIVHLHKAGIPLPDYWMIWRFGWKIEWKIGKCEHTIGWSYAILKNLMESDGVWDVRLGQMDRIWLCIFFCARNTLQDKYNKNSMRSVGQWQWERKSRWNLSKHESHQIMSVNSNAIKLFKIGQ